MNIHIKKNQKIKITASHELYMIMQEVLLREDKYRRRQEHFWVIGLTSSNCVEYIELVALGKVNSVNADPMDIFSLSIQKRCKKIVLVHNHPGGIALPSKDDLSFTKSTVASSRILKIDVLDHIIITEKAYYSLADNGLLL